ncbi:MAG: hypothetical protein CMH26_05315 [Micavibrio sp.]|nr:hypothetical protein [Micavibrio sp.]|tara:strand:+ start:1193 stop:1528 length:336 start_codon:yes stop_codon:yes gene_type:complete
MIRNILNQLLPNKVWLASAIIFALLAGGIPKGRELIVSALLRHGYYERAEQQITLFHIQDLAALLFPLISLLLVMVCKRKGFTRTVHVMNHAHWFLYLTFIFGSQILKGEN